MTTHYIDKINMGIYNIFIVSKSGGLIYHYDHNLPQRETEKTFSYPLDIKLELEQKRVTVVFGERDGIKIGHTLLRSVYKCIGLFPVESTLPVFGPPKRKKILTTLSKNLR